MAIKLHRCSLTWFKAGMHPCWRVQSALDEQGIEYDVVIGPLRRGKREDVKRLTGQAAYPAIEFEDGSAYREESARHGRANPGRKAVRGQGAGTGPRLRLSSQFADSGSAWPFVLLERRFRHAIIGASRAPPQSSDACLPHWPPLWGPAPLRGSAAWTSAQHAPARCGAARARRHEPGRGTRARIGARPPELPGRWARRQRRQRLRPDRAPARLRPRPHPAPRQRTDPAPVGADRGRQGGGGRAGRQVSGLDLQRPHPGADAAGP